MFAVTVLCAFAVVTIVHSTKYTTIVEKEVIPGGYEQAGKTFYAEDREYTLTIHIHDVGCFAYDYILQKPTAVQVEATDSDAPPHVDVADDFEYVAVKRKGNARGQATITVTVYCKK